jgi:hypothetical protein
MLPSKPVGASLSDAGQMSYGMVGAVPMNDSLCGWLKCLREIVWTGAASRQGDGDLSISI